MLSPVHVVESLPVPAEPVELLPNVTEDPPIVTAAIEADRIPAEAVAAVRERLLVSTVIVPTLVVPSVPREKDDTMLAFVADPFSRLTPLNEA